MVCYSLMCSRSSSTSIAGGRVVAVVVVGGGVGVIALAVADDVVHFVGAAEARFSRYTRFSVRVVAGDRQRSDRPEPQFFRGF